MVGVGYSNVLGTLTPKHVHLLPVVFFHQHLEERSGTDVQGGIKARAQYCGFDTHS